VVCRVGPFDSYTFVSDSQILVTSILNNNVGNYEFYAFISSIKDN
jgi:hypothetical protein